MEDWGAVRDRLVAALEGMWASTSATPAPQEADIRAALERVEELEREIERLKALGLERQEWRSRMGLSTQDVIVQRAEAAEAKLARCVEALEQIDRETRSASDVAALRYGSIARAALDAARGGE